MRILMTGAASFTGAWFAHDLTAAGHSVTAPMRDKQSDCAGMKPERIVHFLGGCEMAWDTRFGTPAFLELVEKSGPFDVLCHHAAETKNYKSGGFDAIAAVAANTYGLKDTLERLAQRGCRGVVLTGSVFEADEGAGCAPLRAFSPYGLSKTLTSEAFRFYVAQAGMALGKFVIANPFGPYEEPRFTNHLMKTWKEGKVPRVSTPLYVRDNIHVSLLAKTYCRFVENLPAEGFHKINPSGYVEQQGVFARRFADEMARRLQIATPVEFAEQSDFSEPMVRINTDLIQGADFGWSEAKAWDEVAAYYAERLHLAFR